MKRIYRQYFDPSTRFEEIQLRCASGDTRMYSGFIDYITNDGKLLKVIQSNDCINEIERMPTEDDREKFQEIIQAKETT